MPRTVIAELVAYDNGLQDSELIKELQNRRIPFILLLRDTVKLMHRSLFMRYARRFNYRMEGVEDAVEVQDAKKVPRQYRALLSVLQSKSYN